MFAAPMLTMPDNRIDYGEERWLGIGLVKSVLTVVAYTEYQDTLSIISARKDTKNERKNYEQIFKN